jgi:hypothetical protein
VFIFSRSVCVVDREPLDPRRPSGRNPDDVEGLGVSCDFCSIGEFDSVVDAVRPKAHG